MGSSPYLTSMLEVFLAIRMAWSDQDIQTVWTSIGLPLFGPISVRVVLLRTWPSILRRTGTPMQMRLFFACGIKVGVSPRSHQQQLTGDSAKRMWSLSTGRLPRDHGLVCRRQFPPASKIFWSLRRDCPWASILMSQCFSRPSTDRDFNIPLLRSTLAASMFC